MDPLIKDLVLEARKHVENKEWQQAEELVDKIFALKPFSQKALQLHAIILYQKGLFQKTINAISEVIQNTRPLLMNYELLANCYMRLKQYKNAENTYLKILEDFDQNNAVAHIELAYIYLLKRDWEKGWYHYEFRYSKASQSYVNSIDKSKAWNGKQDLTNKTIILYCEQGYGDFIQFIRYAHKLEEKGAKVLIEVQKELLVLFENICQTINRPFNIEHDYHCSVMSLPYFLNIPSIEYKGKIPYLSAEKFELSENKFKIGIAWTGSSLNPTQDHRSCLPEDFLGLTQIENIKLFNLQKGISANNSNIVEMSQYMTDFAETAKIIQAMDLIITVDTCILHLAGALNKEVWGLLSCYGDWRWGEDETNLWYDSLKIFRQKKFKEWSDVFGAVEIQLKRKLNNV